MFNDYQVLGEQSIKNATSLQLPASEMTAEHFHELVSSYVPLLHLLIGQEL